MEYIAKINRSQIANKEKVLAKQQAQCPQQRNIVKFLKGA
jgi:hypothetical protein